MTASQTTIDPVEQLLRRAAALAADNAGAAPSADIRALIEQLEQEKAQCDARVQELRAEAPSVIVRSPAAAEEHGRKEQLAEATQRRVTAALSVLAAQLKAAIAREAEDRYARAEGQAKDIISRFRALEARRREIHRELVDINVQVRSLAEEYKGPRGALTHTGRLHLLGDDFLAGPRLPENPHFVPVDVNELPAS
jgi:chromosome segregation ATPase